MPLNHHRPPRAASARGTAFVLFASATWLAAAPPAAAQRSDQERSPEAAPEYRYPSFSIERPTLLNTDEITPRLAALFPPALRERGIRSGSASLRFRALADSTVDSASITVEGSSNPAFVELARAIAPRMRFAPVSLDGRTVPAWIRYEVAFQAPKDQDDAEGTYEMPAVEELPVLLNRHDVGRQISALYPPALRASGVPGAILLHFRVSQNGTADPETITVLVVTDLAFEQPAMSVVRRMRFTPAKLGGWPVNVWISLPIQFAVPTPLPVVGDSSGNTQTPGEVPAAPAPAQGGQGASPPRSGMETEAAAR